LRTPSGAPLITLAIPAYRQPGLLAAALASIAAQRDAPDFDVLVCDDGGLPETRAAVEASGLDHIRFVSNQPSLGAVGNWNRCIELARGDWVTILHEDDVLYPWFLQTVVDHLGDDVVAVAVRCVEGTAPPQLAEPRGRVRPRTYAPAWFLKSSMTPFPGVVFSRAVARRIGGFDPAQGGVADYAFWYELACAGAVAVLPVPAAFYRVHPGQWTTREWPRMLRRGHLLRLRVAREQFGADSQIARWIARFYSARMARSYARRFEEASPTLRRSHAFNRIPFSGVSSGWVWALLQFLTRPRFPLRALALERGAASTPLPASSKS
jgi:GT2 family glycosyltransferase